MREKRLNMAIDLLNQTLYFYLCFCCICPILYALTSSTELALSSFCLLPIILLSYLITTKTKQLIVFFALHLVILLGILAFSPSIFNTIIFIAVTLIFMIVNLTLRIVEKTHEKSNSSAFGLIIVVAMQMICNRFHYDFMEPYILYGLLVACLIFCINTYLVNYRNYYINNHEKINVPLRQIERLHHILLSIFIALAGVLMLIISRLPLQNYLSQLGNLLLRLIRKLVSFIRFEDSEMTEPISEEEIPTNDEILPEGLLEDEAHPILDFIYQAVYVLCIILGIAAIIAVVIYLCYKIYQGFHTTSKANGTETKEFISPFTTKKEKERQRDNEGPRSFFLFASNRDKMRKHFYQQLKPNINLEKAPYYTSKQMIQSLNHETTGLLIKNYSEEELLSLHLLYDKARYSNEECTKEDYRKIKKIHLG